MPNLDTLAARARAAYLGADDALDWDELKPCVQDRWRAVVEPAQPVPSPVIADLHRQLEAAKREVEEVRRHISVTMSREHQARREAQEAKRELASLHPDETVEGVIAERDHYKIQLEYRQQDVAKLRSQLAKLRDESAQTIPAKVRFDVTAEEAHKAWQCTPPSMSSAEFYMDYLAKHAVIDATAVTGTDLVAPNMSEIELKAYEQGKQDARAEIEQASDASLTDADVERLAKVIRAAAAKECGCDENSYGTGIFIVEARAALAWMKENGQ